LAALPGLLVGVLERGVSDSVGPLLNSQDKGNSPMKPITELT
jgi:hypothetical protein